MLKDLVMKELKVTLKDLRIVFSVIIMPLIVFLVMGSIMNFAVKVGEETAKGTGRAIIVINRDNGPYSQVAINAIKELGYNVLLVKESNPIDLFGNYTNATLLVEIPEDFSANINEGKMAVVVMHLNIKGLSMIGYSIYGIASSIGGYLTKVFSTVLMKERGVEETEFVLNPLRSELRAYLAGREAPPTIIGMLGFLTSGLLIAPLVMIATAIGVSASLIAMENEERTLEVLLALPISRTKILLAKLIGVLILVILATISFMVGFVYYMSAPMFSMKGEIPMEPSAFNIETVASLMGYHSLVLMGLSTFLSLVAVSALGIFLGSLFPDVRTAQSYIGSLSFIAFVPGMLLMFVDLSNLPLISQVALLLASPFISPVLVLKAAVEGISWIPYASVMWALVFTGLMVIVSAKLLSSERILTLQFSIRMRRLRRR